MNVSSSDGRDCPTLVTVEDCAADDEICDAVTLRCIQPACPSAGARDCAIDGVPRLCVEDDDGELDWALQDPCEANQTCIGGTCRCDNQCNTNGASKCTEDGNAIVTCQQIDGCLREVETAMCQGSNVCVPGQDGAAPRCDCPPIDVSNPEPGKGCDVDDQPFICNGPNSTLECVQDGQCGVWELKSDCLGASSGYACQNAQIILVCQELANANGETCYHPKKETCTGMTTCQFDGASGMATCM